MRGVFNLSPRWRQCSGSHLRGRNRPRTPLRGFTCPRTPLRGSTWLQTSLGWPHWFRTGIRGCTWPQSPLRWRHTWGLGCRGRGLCPLRLLGFAIRVVFEVTGPQEVATSTSGSKWEFKILKHLFHFKVQTRNEKKEEVETFLTYKNLTKIKRWDRSLKLLSPLWRFCCKVQISRKLKLK